MKEPNNQQPLLEVKDLQTCFFTKQGVVKAVDGIDLVIPQGKTVGLVGESGCGKSMTSMSIMGLVAKPGRVTRGEILFQGQNLLQLSPKERRSMCGQAISMIFQEPMTSLNPVMTVGYQVREAILIHEPKVGKVAADARVLELFRQVGMMESVGQGVPQATKLCALLRKRGIEESGYNMRGLVVILVLFMASGFLGVFLYPWRLARIIITVIVFCAMIVLRKPLLDAVDAIRKK